jgi:molybdenum cofactor cytidylyltransferase
MRELINVILAAGPSSRLGQPKQLVNVNGKTLLESSILCSQNAQLNIAVITGAHSEKIIEQHKNLEAEFIFNENWEEGVSSSIRKAVIHFEKDYDAIMFTLCDQYLVSPKHLINLITYWENHTESIVASAYQNQIGVPAIFPKRFFSQLKQLSGDKGAKEIIQNSGDGVHAIYFDEGKYDVDTVEDLEALR